VKGRVRMCGQSSRVGVGQAGLAGMHQAGPCAPQATATVRASPWHTP
jgi:hypothetical protein